MIIDPITLSITIFTKISYDLLKIYGAKKEDESKIKNATKRTLEETYKKHLGFESYLTYGYSSKERHEFLIGLFQIVIRPKNDETNDIKTNFIARFNKDKSKDKIKGVDPTTFTNDPAEIIDTLTDLYTEGIKEIAISAFDRLRSEDTADIVTERLHENFEKIYAEFTKNYSYEKVDIDLISKSEPSDNKFYEGITCRWSDIENEKDFIRSQHDETKDYILDMETRFILIHANPMMGKTVFMKRLAHDLAIKEGKVVFYKKRSPELNSKEIFSYIENSEDETCYVFLDDIGWHEPKICSEFINGLLDQSNRIKVIASMRSMQSIIGTGINYKKKSLQLTPDKDDFKRLQQKIDASGYPTKMSFKNALAKALQPGIGTAEGLFLDVLCYMTENRSYRDKEREFHEELRKKQPHIYDAACLVSLVYQFGQYLPEKVLDNLLEKDWIRDKLKQQDVLPLMKEFKGRIYRSQLASEWLVFDHYGVEKENIVEAYIYLFNGFEVKESHLVILMTILTTFKEINFTVYQELIVHKDFDLIKFIDCESAILISTGLGLIYARDLKDYETAKRIYARALEIDPNCHEAYNNLGSLYYEWAQEVTGEDRNSKLLEAQKMFAHAIRIKNDKYGSWRNIGAVLAQWGENLSYNDSIKKFSNAEKKFKMSLKINVKDYTSWSGWGVLLGIWGEMELNSGKEFNGIKKLVEAREKFWESIKHNPLNRDAYKNLARIDEIFAKNTDNEEEKKDHFENYASHCIEAISTLILNDDIKTAIKDLDILYSFVQEHNLKIMILIQLLINALSYALSKEIRDQFDKEVFIAFIEPEKDDGIFQIISSAILDGVLIKPSNPEDIGILGHAALKIARLICNPPR